MVAEFVLAEERVQSCVYRVLPAFILFVRQQRNAYQALSVEG